MLGKRFLTVLAALSLSCAFVACDDDKEDDNGQEENGGKTDDGKTDDGKTDDGSGNEELDFYAAITAAKADLASCDFSKASNWYDNIYAIAVKSSDKMTAQIAVNRSILGLINLLNNDKLKPILTKFGFETDQMDFSYFWNDANDGVFAIMQSSEKDYGALSDRFKHPAYSGDKDFFDILDKTFTLGDVVKVLVSMESDFDSLAASFEAAGKLLEDGQVIAIGDAGCGLNKLQFSNADLYAFAAFLRAFSSFVEFANVYDLNMTVYDFIEFMSDWNHESNEESGEAACEQKCDKWKEYAQSAFKMLSTVVGKAPNGRVALVDAARLVNIAVSLAPKAQNSSFFGWSTFKSGSIKDVNDILAGVSDNKVVLSAALFSKEMSFDMTKIFDTPTAFDTSDMKSVCYSYYDNEYNECYLEDTEIEGFNEAILDYANKIAGTTIFETDEYGDTYIVDDYSMDYSSAWEDFDFDYFMDPHKYFVDEEEYDDNYDEW